MAGSSEDTLYRIDLAYQSVGIQTASNGYGVMLNKQSQIPCRKFKDFTTCRDNQTEMDIRVLEGDSSKPCENNLLGEFKLKGLPVTIKGAIRVAVVLEVDSHGILKVYANEATSGVKGEIIVKDYLDNNILKMKDDAKSLFGKKSKSEKLNSESGSTNTQGLMLPVEVADERLNDKSDLDISILD